jgi:hypothetical protein
VGNEGFSDASGVAETALSRRSVLPNWSNDADPAQTPDGTSHSLLLDPDPTAASETDKPNPSTESIRVANFAALG